MSKKSLDQIVREIQKIQEQKRSQALREESMKIEEARKRNEWIRERMRMFENNVLTTSSSSSVAPPLFVCAGPGYGAITFSEGGEVTLSVSGASGYAVRLPDSSIVTQTNGEAQEAAGACCLWSANGEEIGGAVVAAFVLSASSMNLSGFQSLEHLLCGLCTMATMDLSSHTSLVSVQNDSEALTHVIMPVSSALETVSFVGASLGETNVNDILANLRAINFDGSCDLSGGTNAAPTGQGITDKAWLIGNGATIYTN